MLCYLTNLIFDVSTHKPNLPKNAHSHSFEELFKHNYAKLCHFAMQFLNDDELAKDVVQETFVSFWDKQAELQLDPATIGSFLYSSVKNACLNKLRRQKLETGYLNKQDSDPAEDAIGLNSMIRSEVIAELHKVITTLPKNCQAIFRMGYLEGLKNPQIAAELGISVNTVKTQKKRGLQLLKMRVNPDLLALVLIFLAQRQ